MFINIMINQLHMKLILVEYPMMNLSFRMYTFQPFLFTRKINYLLRKFFFLEPVKIIVDCQIINEDTLIGLELQQLTPFRYHFHKLWINNYFRQILTPQSSLDINLILNLTNINVNYFFNKSIEFIIFCFIEYHTSSFK